MGYPIPGDSGGSGRVAAGLRISTVSTGGKPGLRVENAGVTYEIFYDVYLKSYNGNGAYTYVYDYWYCRVDGTGNRYTGSNDWVPASGAKEMRISATPVTSLFGKSLGVTLARQSNLRPGVTGPGGSYPAPPDFGWKGTGAGILAGTAPEVYGTWVTPEGVFGSKPPDPGTGDQTAGGDPANSSSDPAAATDSTNPDDNVPGEPIKGFQDNRVTHWNPPPVITTTGAYVPVVYDWNGDSINIVDPSEPRTRQSILGSGTYKNRLRRKATIVQWLKFDDEWRVGNSGSVTDAEAGTKDTWDSTQAIVPSGIRYGFRFMYNPSEIAFNTTQLMDIDPGVIVSGVGKSKPMGDENTGTISLVTYLNRIEDMAFIKTSGAPGAKGTQYSMDGYQPYGGRKIESWHLKNIRTRGTGYDLEYLFRCTLGRAFPTDTRGMTADLGLILGLPLLLNLGGGMSYTGMLTGLSYTHLFFTEDMVPTFTAVSMNFTRFPGATRFNAVPDPGGKPEGSGGKKPGTKGKRGAP